MGSSQIYTGLPATSSLITQVTVSFGPANQEDVNSSTVTVAAPWITAGTKLSCTPSGIATANHDPDDYVVEGIRACPQSIVPGVSFDLVGIAPNGSWGDYIISVVAVTPQ